MLWRVSLEFRDRDGDIGRCQLHSAANSIAALVQFADAGSNAIAALSSAALVGAIISHSWRKPPGTPGALSDSRRRGLILSRRIVAGEYRYGSFSIPSPVTIATSLPSGIEGATRAQMSTSARDAIDALLSLGPLGPDGNPLPSADWIFVRI